MAELVTNENYVGGRFYLLRLETPHWLTPQQAVRWWLFYESPLPIEREPIVLWLRADLAR
jgi:hypothetical protein